MSGIKGSMVTRGSVRGVRELNSGAGPRVQARVCLGASAQHGSAEVLVELKSKEVLEALANLKLMIAMETMTITKQILADQADWDAEKAARTYLEGTA